MDNHNPQTSSATAPYSTLAALLGVSGPLRLLPQGPAPKPHIVLKRDYSKASNNAGESSSSTIRFSFIAGKKFSISKGQPLLFAVASPNDPDGKTLLSDVNAFLLEGDIVDETEESEQEYTGPSELESLQSSKRINIDSLPPRMRKSVATKKAYASYSENEPINSEYSSSAPESAPRAYRSTEVQTDPTPIAKPPEIPSPHRISLSIIQHPDDSPTQLPSPVSADHAREIIPESPDVLVPFDGVDIDADDYARSDRSRSLSPMDLSSESCTPANTLMPLPVTLPEGSVDGLPLESLLMQTSPSLNTTRSMDDTEVASTVLESVSTVASSAAVPSGSLPEVLSPPLSDAPALAAGADVAECPDESKVNLATTAVESQQADLVKKGSPEIRLQGPSPIDKSVINQSEQAEEKAPTTEAFAFPKSPPFEPRAHTREAANIPSAPRAMTQTPRVASQLSEMHEEVPSQSSYKPHVSTPTLAKKAISKAMLSAPTFVKSARASIQGTWDTTPSAPYIPTPTVGNPLGIRPSSSLPPLPKPIPTAPRSLSAATTAKKPIVVGAKWSAARNSGTSVANISSNGVSASSSSSSLSSSSTIPTSPIASTDTTPPVTKTDLSQILRYSSPSPPPQPLTEPPPSPPPHPAPSKWKRVNSNDENLPANNIRVAGPAPEHVVGTENISLKRPHESSTNSSGYTTQPFGAGAEDEHPSKKCKTTDSASPPPSKSTTSAPLVIRVKPLASIQSQSPSILSPTTSSSTVSHTASSYTKLQPEEQPIKVTIPVPKGRAPLTHPLPPKPVIIASGSSYRPQVNRDQKQKQHSADGKRAPAPRTDWPSTSPNAEYRLFNSMVEPSVQKILFNGDGTQVAFICADRTLRIWDNKPSAAAEVARLTHNSQIASACWMEGSPAVMTMCMDGSLSTWTRSMGNEWKFTRLLTVPEVRGIDTAFCMAYAKDHIAVSMPSGVRVWLLISGTWQPQREIMRSGVTALKFVQDGNALIGGCRDGVLWYCEVPNGTLRMHAFLSQKPIISIDIHPTGTYLLVAQEGGKAHLVTMRPNENKGNIERTYTSEKIQSMSQKGFPAVFATKGQAVLYGTVNGCALVWDRKKGTIVYGLKHPEGDPVQAAATFDGRPGVEGWMITGTKQGRLFWWPVPVAAAPSHGASGAGTPDDSERKRQKVAS